MVTLTAEHGLQIPARQPGAESRHDFRPRKVENWLANLPLANIGETARAIFSALTESNRTELNHSQRQKFLELITPTVDHISQSLRKHYVGQSFPLTEKNQKIVSLAKIIQLELALGYKILLVPDATTAQKPQSNELNALCTYRALAHLNRFLLKCYQTYSPVPRHIWREIHQLYGRTEQLQLHSLNIIHPPLPPATVSTIYLQILLLSLADPYSLRQQVLDTVNFSLANWGHLCHLQRPDDTIPHPHTLTVNLSTDQPPGFYETHKLHCGMGCRFLDTVQLIQLMHQLMVTPPVQTDHAHKLTPAVLRHLIIAWSGHSKRSFSRIRNSGKMSLTIGLSATHDYLEQQQAHMEGINHTGLDENPARASFKGRIVPSLNFNDAPDTWDLRPLMRTEPNEDDDDIGDAGHIACNTLQYRIVNESAGGLCLAWNDADSHPNIQIGELVGLANEGPPSEITMGIGAVRWMKTTNNNDLIFGVELLAPEATPVTSSVRNHSDCIMRCLYLPDLITIHQPATLVTPMLYQVGNIIELHHPGFHKAIKLTKLVHNSGIFMQFAFDILEQEKPARSTGTSSPANDLDDVWTLI